MAGSHRSKDVTDYDAKMTLRMPEALRTELQASALEHGRSLNEEVVTKLTKKPFVRRGRTQSDVWRALKALEPKPGDTRTPYEIAIQMAVVKGEPIPDGPPVPDEELEDVEIDWLPGSEPEDQLWQGRNVGARRNVHTTAPTDQD